MLSTAPNRHESSLVSVSVEEKRMYANIDMFIWNVRIIPLGESEKETRKRDNEKEKGVAI